jgi:Protein of unknown function (DUF3027)
MSEFGTAKPGITPSGFEELARTALLEVTDSRTVGPLVSETDEGDGVVSLRFESNLPGYLGWKWTVSVAKVGAADPTVLESELMPGDGALLAPEWVPWSDRLDEYNAGRAAAAAELEDEDDEDDLEDEEDLLDDEDLVDDDLGDDEYDGVDVDAVLEEADEEDLLDAEDGDGFDDAGDEDAATESGSDATAVGVDEPEHAEGDAGDAGPEQAGFVGSDDAAESEQQADERD